MDKTLKELADELGVSKQRISYYLKKLDEKDYQKKDNTIYLKKTGQDFIKSKISTSNTEKSTTKKVDETSIKDYQKNILEDSYKQIENLKEQNKSLTKLLDQQQQLHLQANQRIEMLEKQLSLEEPKTAPQGDVVAKEEFEKLEENRQQLLENIKYQTDKINELKDKLKEDDVITEEYMQEIRRLENELKRKKWFQFWK